MSVICVYIYVELCCRCLYLTVNWCFLSSLNSGTDRESPNNIEKPPNRKPPVKKPRLPQNRNKSLDLSGTCLCFYLYLCVCACMCVISHWILHDALNVSSHLKCTGADQLSVIMALSCSALQTASTQHRVTASCSDAAAGQLLP